MTSNYVICSIVIVAGNDRTHKRINRAGIRVLPIYNEDHLEKKELYKPPDNIIHSVSFDNKLFPDNPRTPTLVPRSGVLAISKPIPIPKPPLPEYVYGYGYKYNYK